MENNDNDIKLNTISEAQLDGIRDSLKTQLDEMVLPYIYKNKLMILNENDKIYQEYLKINTDADKLLEIYVSDSLSEEEKKQKINNSLIDLYKRSKNLIINVSSEEKKTSSDDYNQYKIK